jgi:DNA-binding winged helix-turn-helix (wHTH) protein
MIGGAAMAMVKFGECVLDLEARQLFRNGQPLHLSPKAFELLKILVTERPKAIAKDELHDRIWRGTFVTDDSLAALVAEARAAIGDHARRPAFLRTVHGFGYAFQNIGEAATRETRWLVIVIGERPVMLDAGENVIGRDPASRIFLDSLRVSRRHARIMVREISADIEDLGSRNGTYVNGARITTPLALSHGDQIGIGGFTLIFRAASGSEPTQADE